MRERLSMSLKAKVVAWTQGQSYLWEFLPMLALAIRGRDRTFEDLRALIFIVIAPVFFIVGGEGSVHPRPTTFSIG